MQIKATATENIEKTSYLPTRSATTTWRSNKGITIMQAKLMVSAIMLANRKSFTRTIDRLKSSIQERTATADRCHAVSREMLADERHKACSLLRPRDCTSCTQYPNMASTTHLQICECDSSTNTRIFCSELREVVEKCQLVSERLRSHQKVNLCFTKVVRSYDCQGSQ